MDADRMSGTLAAAVTPLRDSGDRLDEAALKPLLDFYSATGLQGLLVLGTTGEGILLGHDQRRRVAELAVAGAETLRVVIHCGAQTTSETCRLAAHAAEVGADAVAVIAPPYYPLAAGELVEHFASAAAACAPLPFYLYEFADRSGYAIPVTVIEAVGERASNLAGMKVSDAPFERVEPYLATGRDIFIGAEGLLSRGLASGAVGTVSAVAAAFPEAVVALTRDPTPERTTLVESLRTVLSARGFQTSAKAALRLRGLPLSPDVRAPLQPLPVSGVEELRIELQRLVGPKMGAVPA
jgi:dihydrodipicolinate synthase/N-acetylneuraminate lyase